MRLMRRGVGVSYEKEWRRRQREGNEIYEGGLAGRLMRGVRKHALEGER